MSEKGSKDRTDIAVPYAGSALAEAQARPFLRKAIQISSVMDSHGKYFVLALCNDGTIWQLDNLYREGGKEPYWFPFPVPPWHEDME